MRNKLEKIEKCKLLLNNLLESKSIVDQHYNKILKEIESYDLTTCKCKETVKIDLLLNILE